LACGVKEQLKKQNFQLQFANEINCARWNVYFKRNFALESVTIYVHACSLSL
jgi:hypothetical protein